MTGLTARSEPRVALPLIVVAATRAELAGVEAALEGCSPAEVGGRRIVQGRSGAQPVWLLVSGAGMVNTAQALTAVIEHQRPGWVLQTGCAGAFTPAGLALGDIGIAVVEIAPRLGIENPAAGGGPCRALPFGTVGNHKNRYPLDEKLTSRIFDRLRQRYAGSTVAVVKGPFVTVDTITATQETARALHHLHGAVMENMEGSAAAQVCLHYGVACAEMRAASNLVGPRQRELWRLDLACERLVEAVVCIIEMLSNSDG